MPTRQLGALLACCNCERPQEPLYQPTPHHESHPSLLTVPRSPPIEVVVDQGFKFSPTPTSIVVLFSFQRSSALQQLKMARSLQVVALVLALVISCSVLPACARMLNDDIKANSQQKFKHGLPSFALPPKPTLPTLPSLPSCSPPPASPVYKSPPSPPYSASPYSPSPTYKSTPAGGY